MDERETAVDEDWDGQEQSFVGRVLQFLLVGSPVSLYVKALLGDHLHQQLFAWNRLGYWPQIRDPTTFNEKLLHRKVYTDDDRFARVEDKYAVREYVADRVGEDLLPELYCVTDNPTEIPFDELPEEYVIKPTHMSGPVVLVGADETLDRGRVKAQCRGWLDREYGGLKGEYWYSDIEPRIIVEERLRDEERDVPLDFKLFVFHGRVEYIEVDFDRFDEHTRRFYDREWNPQPFTTKFPFGPDIDAPEQLDEMIAVAEALAEPFDFIRVDLYELDSSDVYFGEMTAAHGTGSEQFYPPEYDRKVGDHW